MNRRYCIPHIGEGESTGEIKSFDENKWEKIKSAITIRSQWQKKTKYFDLLQTIPEQYSETQGYHSKCHKNFTAVPANVGCVTHVNLSPTSTLTRSQRESLASTTASSGILPPVCIFCGINRKRNEKLGSNETRSAESRIREVAHQLGDTLLLSKVGDYMFGEGPDFVALEVKYHHSCKRDYLNKIKHTSSSKHTIMKDKAFKFVVNHIRRSIIKADQPELATSDI